MAKRALILGVTGQDGAHLAASLLDKGWTVIGGFRRGAPAKLWRLNHLKITRNVDLVDVDITDPLQLLEVIRAAKPDAVYHLAGESFVADSFKHPAATVNANTVGAINVMEAVRREAPEARLFLALSSEVFGRNQTTGKLTEDSATTPNNPYGISKLSAWHFARMYRESYGMFIAGGILFNHEGPLRARSYVTRKITFNMARLKIEGGEPVNLGLMCGARDWGAAVDYVEAMQLMMQAEKADDFVVATGQLTTVRAFVEIAAAETGFDPEFSGEGADEVCIDRKSGKPLAQVSKAYLRPFDTPPLAGDASKIKSRCGWQPELSLDDLARDMVKADITRWQKGQTDV